MKYFFLLLIVFLSVWAIVITYGGHLRLGWAMEYDEAIYLSIARKSIARNIHENGFPIRPIGENGVFSLDHPHFALFILSFWEWLFSPDFFSIRLFNMLTWFLPFIVIVFLFGKELSNLWGGILAVFWVVSSPFILHNAILTKLDVPQMVMCTLILFLFYLFYKKDDGNPILRWFVLGILFSLATLTKEAAALMLIPMSVILFKHYYTGQTVERDKILKIIFPFIAGTIVILIPWLVYCYLGGGHVFTIVQHALFMSFNPTKYRNAAPVLDYWKILYKWIGYPLVFAFLISVLLVIRTKSFKKDSFILLLVWVVTILISFSFISTRSFEGRYFLSMIPAFILLSSQIFTEKFSDRVMAVCFSLGFAISLLLRIIYKDYRSIVNSQLLFFVSALLLIVLSLWVFTSYFRSRSFEYILVFYIALLIGIQGSVFYTKVVFSPPPKMGAEVAGEWIKNNTRKDDLMLSNAPQAAFFADRNYFLSQYDRTGTLYDLLDNRKIKIIYLDSYTEFFNKELPMEKQQGIFEKIHRQFDLVMSDDEGKRKAFLYQRKEDNDPQYSE